MCGSVCTFKHENLRTCIFLRKGKELFHEKYFIKLSKFTFSKVLTFTYKKIVNLLGSKALLKSQKCICLFSVCPSIKDGYVGTK